MKMNSKTIYTFLSWFAIVATPLAPVFFFGHKIYIAISGFEFWGHWFIATTVGILSAIGLELIGILAGHACIEYIKQKQVFPALLAGVILLAYTGIGIYELQGTIGAVLYLIAPMVYILVGMQSVINETSQQQQEDKAHERKIEARKQQLDHQLKLADKRIKLEKAKAKLQQASIEQEQAKHEPVVKQVVVCSCGKEFATVQGKNAHLRFCKVRQNGKVMKDGIVGG